jgi:hypothetical protein
MYSTQELYTELIVVAGQVPVSVSPYWSPVVSSLRSDITVEFVRLALMFINFYCFYNVLLLYITVMTV